MREIKFRAWIRREQKMFFVLQLEWNTDRPDEWHSIHLYPLRIIQAKDFEINGLELMQFTGLRDKNGKEIYEGDILAGMYGEQGDKPHERIVGGVEWRSAAFIFRFGYQDMPLLKLNGNHEILWHVENHLSRAEWFYEVIGIEVIGNIFDHPELLK